MKQTPVSYTHLDVYKRQAVGSIIKDAKQKEGFLKNFKASFNEKILKEQFSKNLNLIPAKGAKIGEKWTHSENATPDGKIKLSTNYVIKNIENGLVNIGVTGGIQHKSDKRSEGGMTRSMSCLLYTSRCV